MNRLISTTTNYNFDSAGAFTVQYGYDAASDRVSMTDPQSAQTTYGYDTLNRLTILSYGSQTFGFGYDVLSRRTSLSRPNGVNTSYNYDNLSRLLSVLHTSGSTTLDGGSTATYQYDAEGHRIHRVYSGGSLDYVFDREGRAISEVTSMILGRGEIYAGGRHVATYRDSTTYLNFSDWLGTERVRTNVAGTTCEIVTSLPFGDAQATSGTCGDVNPFHFTGKDRDIESNLDDFPARYYSSTQGRWMSPDWSPVPVAIPYANLADPRTLNLYDYVGDDPTNHPDADGHFQAPGTESQNACGTNPQCATNQVAQNKPAESVTAPFPIIPATPAIGKAVGAVADFVGDALGSALGVVLVVFTPTQTANEAQDTIQYKGGPKAADAPGVTAGGQATDAHGNKLGPSGETQVDRTRSNTREGARNRALGEGSGAVEHSNPRVGSRHWHPTDAQGNKKPSSAHHEYPDE